MRLPHRIVLIIVLQLLAFGVKAQSTSNSYQIWQDYSKLASRKDSLLWRQRQFLQNSFGVEQHRNYNLAFQITDTLARVCLELGDSAAHYEALYRNKAILSQPLGQYEKTFTYLIKYAEAMRLMKTQNAYVYVDIGNIYFSLGMDNLAKRYYFKAFDLFMKANNYGGQCTVYDNVSQIFGKAQQHDSAVHYAKKSLQLRKEKIKDPYVLAHSYMALGFAQDVAGLKKDAIGSIQQSLMLFNRPEFKDDNSFHELKGSHLIALRILASLWIETYQYDSARYAIKNLETLVQDYNVESAWGGVYANKVKLFTALNQHKLALLNADLFVKFCIKRGDQFTLAKAYRLNAEALYAAGQFDQAYQFLKKSEQLSDSLSRYEYRDLMFLANDAVLQLENSIVIDKQLNELAQKEYQVQAEKRVRNYSILAAVALGLVLVLVGYIALRVRRQNKYIAIMNADLNKANQAKEKMLAVIGHDLRTPFNAVISMSSLLRNSLEKNNMDRALELVDNIDGTAKGAYQMTDSIMQWVVMEKQGILFKAEELEVSSLFAELRSIFRSLAASRDCNLSFSANLRVIYSDRQLVMIVLRNLISNALKFAAVPGEVLVSIRHHNGEVIFEITDNGPGFSGEASNRVNQRFSAIHVTAVGSGLGLTLVKDIVKILGGRLLFNRINDSRTVVSVTLPFKFVSKVEELSEDEKVNPVNTDETDAELEQMKMRIAKYEIFEVTRIRRILEDYNPHSEPGVSWKRSMLQTLYEGDEARFKLLCKLHS